MAPRSQQSVGHEVVFRGEGAVHLHQGAVAQIGVEGVLVGASGWRVRLDCYHRNGGNEHALHVAGSVRTHTAEPTEQPLVLDNALRHDVGGVAQDAHEADKLLACSTQS